MPSPIDDLKSQRTVCIIHRDNRPSIRVAENLGYAGFGETEYRGARPTIFERL